MILHTIIEPDIVLNQVNSCEHRMVQCKNCLVDAVKFNDQYVINRLISTNPQDYLNVNLELGKKLNLK